MSSSPVDEWSLVREQFQTLVRERSDNIDDLLDAQFCNRFGQLITHATDRARLRAQAFGIFRRDRLVPSRLARSDSFRIRAWSLAATPRDARNALCRERN
jgi:alpha-ketoglutarate-dependent taurine dioxygenase